MGIINKMEKRGRNFFFTLRPHHSLMKLLLFLYLLVDPIRSTPARVFNKQFNFLQFLCYLQIHYFIPQETTKEKKMECLSKTR